MIPDFRLDLGALTLAGSLTDIKERKTRLLSMSITDEAEDKSDTLQFELDARPDGGAFVPLPPIGQEVMPFLGYRGKSLTPMGRFVIAGASVGFGRMMVDCKSANLVSSYRTPRNASYHEKSLSDIAREIAGRHGYEPVIDESLGGILVNHIDQFSESDMSFLTRLASEMDGVARPVDGKLVIARRATGKSISGAILGGVSITPADVVGGEDAFTYSYSGREEGGQAGGMWGGDDRKEPGGYRAHYYDTAAGEKATVEVGSAPFKELRMSYPTKPAAEAAANARHNQDVRGAATFDVTVLGNPGAMAEGALNLSGFHPQIPALWRIKSVSHSLDSSGFETSITAEIKQETQKDPPAKASEAAGSSRYGWAAPYIEQ